jgi:hypothetical protein
MAWTIMNLGDDVVSLTLEFHGEYRCSPAELAAATDAGATVCRNRIVEYHAGTEKADRVASTLRRIPDIVAVTWAAGIGAHPAHGWEPRPTRP